ncbi:ATP-binding cassette, subfamily B, MsbA [Thiohalospira halophila DSM 15071]|uniref:ATP-binding cassette, subfamily B, MsbA n=2 Tax=Thiohalospira halophila TaxID=381300 RepID=A0A1I1P0Z1_9GAMM|nr:ATP-binding cassette, subfamily B, MsbA [Thiohalospira halophila DSM 15071]
MSTRRAEDRPLEMYKRLLGYTWPYWRVFGVGVLAMVIMAATETGFAALMKPLMDGTFVEEDPTLVTWMPWLIIGVAIIRAFADFGSSYAIKWVARSVVRDLRGEMFRHLLRLPIPFFDTSSTGGIISKLNYDVEQVAKAASQAITVLIKDSLTVLGLLGWMIWLSPRLVLVFLVLGPLFALIVRSVSQRFRKLSRRIQVSMGDVSSATDEAVGGQRVIKIFGGEGEEARQFAKVNENNRRQQLKKEATNAISVPVIQFLVAIAIAAVVYIATLPGMREEISVGTFMSFMAAMAMMLGPVKRLTKVNAVLQQGIAASQSVFGLLDTPPELNDGSRRIERAQGRIDFEQVWFAYGEDQSPVLRGIDLQIASGETLAIVGRSGGGKSTLVNLIPRFYSPQKGVVRLDGVDLTELELKSLRQQIALVSQDVVLFNASLAENIAYAREGADRAAVERASELAHVTDFAGQLADGLDTEVGENGALLSGGQRQRVAIARAILKDAPILILDEATSALDNESERHIRKALEALMEDRTTVVIAHRLSTIERADRIAVMDRGRLVEAGTHAELLAHGGAYADLHQAQFDG